MTIFDDLILKYGASVVELKGIRNGKLLYDGNSIDIYVVPNHKTDVPPIAMVSDLVNVSLPIAGGFVVYDKMHRLIYAR